jgi:hypothetical protein
VSLNHISPWIGGGDTGGESNNVAANASTAATNQQTVPGENLSHFSAVSYVDNILCRNKFPNYYGILWDKDSFFVQCWNCRMSYHKI